MRCDVCGQDYEGIHNCTAGPSTIAREEGAFSPSGTGLLYYLRLAIKIATWDRAAMRRAADDSKAAIYGTLFLLIIAIPTEVLDTHAYVTKVWHLATPEVPKPTLFLIFAASYIFGVVAALVIVVLAPIGLCHFICKWLLHAKGTLKGVLRPLLLGSIVTVLGVIPVIGDWVFGIAWTAVMIVVFHEVDGIDPLYALVICLVLNVFSHELLGRIF
jgi:predicted PurR-regulated permease PerM